MDNLKAKDLHRELFQSGVLEGMTGVWEKDKEAFLKEFIEIEKDSKKSLVAEDLYEEDSEFLYDEEEGYYVDL